MRGTPKELTVLIRKAEKQGWRVNWRRNNHLKWVSPTGECVWSSGTPSDIRAVNQITRDLLRHGFVLNEKGK